LPSQKIYSFFNHLKYKKRDASNDSSFSTWLMQLRKPVGRAPRVLPAYKFYMAHEDYESKVDSQFDIEWPAAGLPKSHQLDFRCKVAKRLFDDEPLDVQTKMEADAKAAYEVALDAHASGIRSEPTEDHDEQDLSVFLLFALIV
jgi:hypothetical protein